MWSVDARQRAGSQGDSAVVWEEEVIPRRHFNDQLGLKGSIGDHPEDLVDSEEDLAADAEVSEVDSKEAGSKEVEDSVTVEEEDSTAAGADSVAIEVGSTDQVDLVTEAQEAESDSTAAATLLQTPLQDLAVVGLEDPIVVDTVEVGSEEVMIAAHIVAVTTEVVGTVAEETAEGMAQETVVSIARMSTMMAEEVVTGMVAEAPGTMTEVIETERVEGMEGTEIVMEVAMEDVMVAVMAVVTAVVIVMITVVAVVTILGSAPTKEIQAMVENLVAAVTSTRMLHFSNQVISFIAIPSVRRHFFFLSRGSSWVSSVRIRKGLSCTLDCYSVFSLLSFFIRLSFFHSTRACILHTSYGHPTIRSTPFQHSFSTFPTLSTKAVIQ